MTDLGDHIRRMLESGAQPIAPEQIADLGARRARRRHTARAGLAISMLLILLVLIVRPGPEIPEAVETVGTTSTTAAPPSSSATTSATTSSTTTVPATTAPLTTVAVSPPPPPVSVVPTAPPTTTITCRNSFEPSCGPFYYDPPVSTPNTKAVIKFVDHATTASVGQPYVLKVHVSDPDTPFQPGSCVNYVDWGPSSDPICVLDPVDCMVGAYGPWDPPVPEPSDFVEEFTYTYTQPGTYEVIVRYSGRYSCKSPYAESAEARFTLTVTAKP